MGQIFLKIQKFFENSSKLTIYENQSCTIWSTFSRLFNDPTIKYRSLTKQTCSTSFWQAKKGGVRSTGNNNIVRNENPTLNSNSSMRKPQRFNRNSEIPPNNKTYIKMPPNLQTGGCAQGKPTMARIIGHTIRKPLKNRAGKMPSMTLGGSFWHLKILKNWFCEFSVKSFKRRKSGFRPWFLRK